MLETEPGCSHSPSHHLHHTRPHGRRRPSTSPPASSPAIPALLLLASFVSGVRSQSVFLTQPRGSPYLQKAGDRGVELACSVREEYADGLQWLSVSGTNKFPRIISLGKTLRDPSHYDLLTDGARGTYNLRIKEVEFGKDNANFFCQVDNPDGDPFTSIRAQVIVLVRPEAPSIVKQTRLPVREGSQGYAECASKGGNPPPTITWLFPNNSRVPESFVRTVNGSVGEETTSTVQWTMSAADDGGSVTCRVWNAAMGEEAPLSVSSAPFAVQYAPVVTLGSDTLLRVEENGQTELRCEARGNPSLFTYEWVHSSGRAVPAHGADSGVLSFRVSVDSAGMYTCRVKNAIGTGEAVVTLDVLYGPRLKVQPVYTVARDSRVTLDCQVDANPPAEKISWSGPDGRHFEGSSMELNAVTRENAGNYTCEAINSLPLNGGTETRIGQSVSQLKVLYPPGRASIRVQESMVVVGSSVTLFCSASEPGEPAAEFRWKAPGMNDYLSYNPQSTYTIPNIQLANAGEYWCKPENQLGPNQRGEGAPGSYILRVVQPAQLDIPLPSQPLELLANATAQAISCEGRGNPAPLITWTKDGEALTNEAGESEAPSRWEVVSTEAGDECSEELRCSFRVRSSLRWAGPLRWSDKGRYGCRVSNGAGAYPESSLLVRVRHAPHIDSHASRTQAGADVPGTARIACRTSALPEPTFRWTFQGGQDGDIQEGGRFSFQVEKNRTTDTIIHTLTIIGVRESDFGTYLCRANNQYGTATQQFTLRRTREPETPTGLKVVSAGSSWLRVGWEPGFNGGYPQNFSLQLTPLDPLTDEKIGRPSTFQISGPDSESGGRFKRYVNDVFDTMIKYNTTGLLPEQKFGFAVQARNRKGETEWSREATGKTRAGTPDRALIKVASAIYNADEGSLSFKPTIPSREMCLLVVMESAERRGDWATYDCLPTDAEKAEGLPAGAAKVRLAFCRREDAVCGNMTDAMHAKDVGTGGVDWGTVAPIIAVAALVILLALIAVLCCCVRNRQSQPKPKRPVAANLRSDYEMETNAGRPKAISAPFLQEGSLEKVPVESGSSGHTGLSNGDSGVFTTLGSLSHQPYGDYNAHSSDFPGYHNGAYGAQPASDADRWGSALDPFDPQDPYSGGYGMDYGDGGAVEGLGGPGYYDPYGNPGGMVDLNPQGTHPSGGSPQEGSINSGYSTPNQRRVMREIIV